MWNKRFIYISLILLTLCSLNGCKTLRQLPSQMKQLDMARQLIENNSRVKQMDAKCTLQWSERFTSRINGQMSLGEESIYLSVQPLFGIESHRMYADPHVIQFIDRGQKAYMADSLKFLNMPAELAVKLVRGIFSNQIVSPSNSILSLSDFDYHFDEQQQLHLSCKAAYGLTWKYIIDEKGYLSNLNVFLDDRQVLYVSYRDFQVCDGGIVFPQSMTIATSEPIIGSTNKAITVTFSNISFDKEPKTAFTIPSNYRKIDVMELLKSLTNLF